MLTALVSGAASACATLPAEGPERGLYVDLRKAVDLREDTSGWIVDRVEIEAQSGTALRSACQVDAAARLRLDAWLETQILNAGGPARELYEKNGEDLDAAHESLTLERVRSLLRHAEDRLEEDCPFWLHVDPEFAGVEGDAQRVVFWLETIGGGALVIEGKNVALGGGGGGRVLVGYGFGPRFTLAIGGELGAAGAFIENEMGNRIIDTTFTAAIPVVLRLTDVSRIYDLELAPIMRLDHGDYFPPGLRATLGAGVTGQRGSAFMPYILLWVGYELHPATRVNKEADHSFLIGTRVGVDLDP